MWSDIWDRETIVLAVCWLLTTFPHKMSKILFSRSRCRQVSSASPDAEPGRGLLLPALPPAPGLPVPGAEHGQGLPRPPHGVLGQHYGPEGKKTSAGYLVSDRKPLSKGFIFLLFPSGKLEFSPKENWKPNWERVGTLLSPTLSRVLLS